MPSDLPDGWQMPPMGKIVEQTLHPHAVESNRQYALLGVRWYCAGPHLHNVVDGAELKTPRLTRVTAGDITYNKMWVKKAAFAVLGDEHEGLFATAEYPTFRARADLLNTSYLRFLMQTDSFQNDAASVCKGTTSRARLDPKDFLRLHIPLPPLCEQNKIASILSSVDEAIQATQAVIDQTRRVKQGVLQDLLTRGIGHSRFKPTELGEIPETWSVVSVTEACHDVFLGLTAKVEYVDEGGIPLIRGKDIATGALCFNTARSISPAQHERLTARRRPRRGDVLVSKSGTLGTCALVDTDRDFSIYESIIDLQPDPETLSSEFLLWLLRAPSTQDRILGHTVGSTVGHLNLLQFRRLRIPLPPLPEQLRIAAALSGVEAGISAGLATQARQEKLKAGLLLDLLTGKTRVST